ncbi:two-component system sensor histidine kinase CreC [Pelagicoccus sp. SDUM812002]|uniref:two-component system sensor histidine kinase CreC n=1 Tax=Pelagicoccus sp. SDUM812002 TaxID=3041266 RepID=UPI0028105D47|nr:two-component system sensor histidine kinase CreC [Pelagicoccus sp. SDUM812002]MDQ8186572.1 two-component system sensor histidine kinase CreC [Pelagicoccus sp. SDUM812002]
MKSLWRILTNPDLRGPLWLRLPKKLISIRASILLVYLLVVGGGFYAIMSTMTQEIQPRYLESMEESLVDTANILAAQLEHTAEREGLSADTIAQIFERAYERRFEAQIYTLRKESVDLEVYLTDAAGKVLFDSSDKTNEGKDFSQWIDVSRTLEGQYGARATWTSRNGEKALVLYVAAPVRLDGRIQGVVTVGKPTSYVNELISRAEDRFELYVVIAGVAVLLLGAVLSVWLTQPIKRLIAYANALRDGRKAQYPRLFGIEANELGRAFEEMRVALEGKQYVERYVQSLTHQLKSPISGISGAAELLEGGMEEAERIKFLANVRRESERLRRIVDRMLDLASVEARRALQNVESIDLAELVEEIVETLEPRFRQESVAVSIQRSGAESIRGERFLVRQAIQNILQNSLDFSPTGSSVSVIIEKHSVCVEDEGPGIPDYALSKVTERFYSLVRPKTGEKSSGVGLSFVKEIMGLHEGTLRVENRGPGGVRVVLGFP